MSFQKQTRRITLVGANGTIGAPILTGLVEAGHSVTVLTRPTSPGDYPESVRVFRCHYDDADFIETVLRGQDVLIMALGYRAHAAQVPLIKAAARAGVPYLVPCEFGSDPTHPKLNEEVGLMNSKLPFRQLIEELGVSSWIGVITNPWYEYTLRVNVFGVDLKHKTARLFDDGSQKANFTTLPRVGQSLAALFTLPEEELSRYKNDWVYFSSFLVSQRDVLESAMRVSGDDIDDWKVERTTTQDVLKTTRARMAKGDNFVILVAALFTDGWGGDYTAKVVDYERLGLEPENLDDVMKPLVRELSW